MKQTLIKWIFLLPLLALAACDDDIKAKGTFLAQSDREYLPIAEGYWGICVDKFKAKDCSLFHLSHLDGNRYIMQAPDGGSAIVSFTKLAEKYNIIEVSEEKKSTYYIAEIKGTDLILGTFGACQLKSDTFLRLTRGVLLEDSCSVSEPTPAKILALFTAIKSTLPQTKLTVLRFSGASAEAAFNAQRKKN
jgi:hypothetical protein